MIDTPHADPLPLHPGPLSDDPSRLTTAQILRENAWLRELLRAEIGNLGTRINGIDRAMALLQAALDRDPPLAVVDSDVKHLRELVTQKFNDGKTALDAAMASQDRATVKQEGEFTKQIGAIDRRIDDNKKATEATIGDLKERLTSIEAFAKGRTAVVAMAIGGGGLLIAAITLVILFVKTST